MRASVTANVDRVLARDLLASANWAATTRFAVRSAPKASGIGLLSPTMRISLGWRNDLGFIGVTPPGASPPANIVPQAVRRKPVPDSAHYRIGRPAATQ